MGNPLRQATRTLSGFRRFPRALAMLGSGEWARLTHYLRATSPEAARALFVELARADRLVIDFEREGVQWRVDIGDEIGEQLYVTGGYEQAEIAAVLRWLDRDRGVVVDVGANVGTTSIPFAQKGYRVVAVEPVETTFEMLQTNVSRNGFDAQISCVRSAISEHKGTIEMWTGTGSGQAEVVVHGRDPAMLRWGGTGERVAVAASALDELLDARGIEPSDVALVWADVQGAETSVIRTGERLWRADVPLYVEVDPVSLELHAGMDAFVASACAHFDGFIPRDDLLVHRGARPLTELARWATTIPATGYSDALLVHGDFGE